MLTKNDCMSILVDLENTGLHINDQMRALLSSKEIPLEVLKFIVSNKGVEASNFYEFLRRKHNEKKSKLYTNLLRDLDDEFDIITTLSSLVTQIFLHGSKIENYSKFYREIRLEEILRVLHEYSETEQVESCKKVLSLIKSDLMVFEYLNDRRKLSK